MEKKRKRTNELPLCQYGSKCYRKNPEHLKKFCHDDIDEKDSSTIEVPKRNDRRSKKLKGNFLRCKKGSVDESKQKTKIKDLPSEDFCEKETEISDEEKEDSSKRENSIEKLEEIKNNTHDSETEKISLEKSALKLEFSETAGEILKKMPKDFFDFWKFCSTLNKLKPQEAFIELGFSLIGIYDLLSHNIPADNVVNMHCHWRYYFDPPEFQTVIKLEGKELYHIGYFRDDPNEWPLILASNSAKNGCKLSAKGDNIFAAMNFEITEALKKSKDKKFRDRFLKIQEKMKIMASQNKYSLEIQSAVVKSRNKKVVAKTFHGLGIVVPLVNDVGYRPLPDSDATIKSIFKKIISAPNEDKRLEEEEPLDELITNVQFANDECDYGMGLELGIDLFCFGHEYFHSRVLHLLPLAYNLLKRPKYAEIVKAHLLNRKLSDSLDTSPF